MDFHRVSKFMFYEEVETSDICHVNRLFERDKLVVNRFLIIFNGEKRGVSHSESDQ